MTSMSNNHRLILFGAVCGMSSALAMFLLLAGHNAWADNDGDPGTESVPRTIHYGGDIDWDGEPYDGDVTMRFSLYGAPDGEEVALWAETHDLRARRGRFSAELGSVAPIAETIYDAGPLFLGVEVQRPEDEAFVALGNRQKLNPVPYAMLATNAANLDVAGVLTNDGAAVFNGPATFNGPVNIGQLQLSQVYRANSAATFNITQNMGSASNRFCFLIRSNHHWGGSGATWSSSCRIEVFTGNYVLSSGGQVSGSSSHECEAQCFIYKP